MFQKQIMQNYNRSICIIIHNYYVTPSLLLRLFVGRGRVINSPRSVFLRSFSVSKIGQPLMDDTAGLLLSEIMSPRLLNCIFANHVIKQQKGSRKFFIQNIPSEKRQFFIDSPRFHQGMISKFPCQISNSNYAIDNVLVICFVFIWFQYVQISTLKCKKNIALVVFGKRRKMFIERRLIERHLLESKDVMIFCCHTVLSCHRTSLVERR